MAEIVSGKDLTVIVLTNDEVEELTELLMVDACLGTLDELTSALAGINTKKYQWDVARYMREGYEPVTSYDKPEPSWKDEPTSDYRFGRG